MAPIRSASTVVLNGIDHRRFRRDPARVADARAALGAGARRPRDRRGRSTGTAKAIRPAARGVRGDRRPLSASAFVHRRRRQSAASARARRSRPSISPTAAVLVGHADDVVPAYHAFDLLVQSSDYEGTPNAVLEAMAFEVPIVATAAGGTAEIVRDGVDGRIVPIGRPDLLIDSVMRALEDPAATTAMAQQARARVEGELSFETRVRRIERIYSEMVPRA